MSRRTPVPTSRRRSATASIRPSGPLPTPRMARSADTRSRVRAPDTMSAGRREVRVTTPVARRIRRVRWASATAVPGRLSAVMTSCHRRTPMTMVRFPTADGLELEGELRTADGVPRGTAVLCHAHPRHGGSKDHPVLWAIRNDLAAKRGRTVLAFNFRGIMGSEGTYGGGEAELADAAAAVDRVRQEAPGPTVMAGWSFGAWVAFRHAVSDRRVPALVLLGIPLGEFRSDRRPLPSLAELEEL